MADFGTQVLGIIGTVAPTIANCLGGPLAGLGVKAICSALGLPEDAAPATVSAALTAATPDQLLALKNADNTFALQMKSLDVDFAKVSQTDIASARTRETAVHDSTPSILAYALTLGFFGLLWLMVFHDVPSTNAGAVNILLGSLGTAWIASINYFFGSTYSSKTKDAMLFQSVPATSLAEPLVSRAPGPGRSESPASGGSPYAQ